MKIQSRWLMRFRLTQPLTQPITHSPQHKPCSCCRTVWRLAPGHTAKSLDWSIVLKKKEKERKQRRNRLFKHPVSAAQPWSNKNLYKSDYWLFSGNKSHYLTINVFWKLYYSGKASQAFRRNKGEWKAHKKRTVFDSIVLSNLKKMQNKWGWNTNHLKQGHPNGVPLSHD